MINFFNSNDELTILLISCISRYKREFGFTIPDRPIIVDDIRVRGTGRSGVTLKTEVEPASGPPKVEKVTPVG